VSSRGIQPVRRDLKAKLRSVITGHLEGGGNLIADRDDDILTGLGLPDHQVAFVVLHIGPAEPRQFARPRSGQVIGSARRGFDLVTSLQPFRKVAEVEHLLARPFVIEALKLTAQVGSRTGKPRSSSAA
jgi:hypothetical protein